MPCLIAAMLLGTPRLVIILMVFFSDYLGRGLHGSIIWPLLGFCFLPYTTIAYAVGMNMGTPGELDGAYIILLVVAILFDLGIFGDSVRLLTRRAPVQARR